MSNYLMELKELLYILPAILLAFTFHEYAHAFASYKLGDPTPKEEGRLSLNPFIHLDWIGTLMLIIFKFGWAKPVMVNPSYYKKPKRDMGLVALAGPATNFLLAFFAIIISGLLYRYSYNIEASILYSIFHFFLVFANINIGLGVFNMLPLPPLDGSKVVAMFLPDKWFVKFLTYESYGMAILLVLVFSNLLSTPLHHIMNVVYYFYEFIISIIVK